MRFIFVRHGKTHFNEINLTQGWCDSPLSKVGIRQVESISKQLEQYQIDKAYTSPLGRAVQTANIILSKKGIEPIYEERFKEVNFGILEGISTELVRKLNIESPNWLENLEISYYIKINRFAMVNLFIIYKVSEYFIQIKSEISCNG